MESVSIYKKGYLNDVPIPFIRFYLMDLPEQYDIVPFCIYDLAVRCAKDRNFKIEDCAQHLIESYYSEEPLTVPLLDEVMQKMDMFDGSGLIDGGDDLRSKMKSLNAVVEESKKDAMFKSLMREYYCVCYAVERVGYDSEKYDIMSLREVWKRHNKLKTRKIGGKMPTFYVKTETLARHMLDRKKIDRRMFATYLSINSVVGKSNKVFPATREMIAARMMGAATPEEVCLELKDNDEAMKLFEEINTRRIMELCIKKVCNSKTFKVRKSEGKIRYGNFFAINPKMTDEEFEKEVEKMKVSIKNK